MSEPLPEQGAVPEPTPLGSGADSTPIAPAAPAAPADTAGEDATSKGSSGLVPRLNPLHVAHLVRGQRLAHFELESPIGVGGMAAVIRARDTQLGRTVALKILPPEMAADADNIRRFENEA